MFLACPNCRSDVPGPQLRATKHSVRVRCKVCHSLLSMTPPPRLEQEFDSTDFIGKSLNITGLDVLGVLGRGGMGMVYSAVRDLDRELVAIKVLPPECLRYPELIERFDFEARTMARLSHPNIVPILDRGRWNEHPYIVMEYVPGRTLKERIEKHAPLSIDETLAVAAPVAEAIQRCHDAGFVHRDLKPANVLLSQTGRVLVTDFGIASLLQLLGERTDHGVAIGTPQYIAPEQLRNGSSVDVRADQYSLAVIMFEMLTGELPVGVFDPPTRTCKELTPEAEAMLLKALARRPEDRFESIRQFVRNFRRALARPSTSAVPEDFIRAASTPAPIDASLVPTSPSGALVQVVSDSDPVEDEDDNAAAPATEPPPMVERIPPSEKIVAGLDATPRVSEPPRAATPEPKRVTPRSPTPRKKVSVSPPPVASPPRHEALHLILAGVGLGLVIALAVYLVFRVV